MKKYLLTPIRVRRQTSPSKDCYGMALQRFTKHGHLPQPWRLHVTARTADLRQYKHK
ncbi:hypothetical protein AVEN_73371-1, partial [Araneus ventricosus]